MKPMWIGLGLIVAAVAGGAFWWSTQSAAVASQPSARAAAFFDESNVRVNHADGRWWLRLETPEDVLCAVNVGPVGGDFERLTAMDMTAPARDHDIALALSEGSSYRVVLTAFTSDREVLRSQVYLVSAQTVDDPQQDLIAQREGEALSLQPAPAGRALQSGPDVAEVEAQSALVTFNTRVPTLASTAFGPGEALGRSARMSNTEPFTDHRVQLLALDPETPYRAEVALIDAAANVYRAKPVSFKTAAASVSADGAFGPNVAAEGTVRAVSSNWGGGGNDSSFGANHAIDGDPKTEWSSDGEGDDAWIEIELAEPAEIVGIGVWSRTMGDSADILRFRVLSGEGEELGVFDLPDVKQRHAFALPPTTVSVLRFEVVEPRPNRSASPCSDLLRGSRRHRRPH